MPLGFRKDGTKLGFQKGHHINKGKIHTLETRNKMSKSRLGEKNPHYGIPCCWTGKKLPEYMKDKISKALKGKKKTEEHKKNLSISHKIFYNTPKGKEIIRRNGMCSKVAFKDTRPERLLQEELLKRKLNFEKHLNINDICKPDIIFKDNLLIVQVDGIYWHNLPNVKKRDEIQDNQLLDDGWTVLRFWETDIYNDINKCGDLIESCLIKRGGN